MERVIKIKQLKDNSSDYLYWMTLSPADRLNAIEFLRSLTYSSTDAGKGLQRVFTITQLK